MTVIAYDGVTVAADKMSSADGIKRTVTKLHRASDRAVLAITGMTSAILELVAWYEAGCPANTLPRFEIHTELCVFLKGRRVVVYAGRAFPIFFEDPLYANGCGEDFAMGAMAAGATPYRAVEIACRYREGCGMGIDTMEVEEHVPRDTHDTGSETVVEGGEGPAPRGGRQGLTHEVPRSPVGGAARDVSGMRWEPPVASTLPEPP